MLLMTFEYTANNFNLKDGQSEDELLHKRTRMETFMIVLMIFLGLSFTIKTAISPQITPFIVRDTIKIESGNAYMQAMNHSITCFSLFAVGILEYLCENSAFPIFLFLFTLSTCSLIAFWLLYHLDVRQRDGLLDSQKLSKDPTNPL